MDDFDIELARENENMKDHIAKLEQKLKAQQELIEELTQCLRLRVNCLSHGDLISQEKREMDLLDKIRRQALEKLEARC